jgi:hypothetical protein
MTAGTVNWDFWRTIVQAVGYAVTWLIVVYGWRVTNRHNHDRDLRKDLREQIDLVGELVRQVEGDLVCLLSRRYQRMGASYWTVYFDVQRISAAVCRNPLLRESNVVDALIAYRIAVTGHALPGPATVHVVEEVEDVLKLVCGKGNDLMKALDGYYFRRYAV